MDRGFTTAEKKKNDKDIAFLNRYLKEKRKYGKSDVIDELDVLSLTSQKRNTKYTPFSDDTKDELMDYIRNVEDVIEGLDIGYLKRMMLIKDTMEDNLVYWNKRFMKARYDFYEEATYTMMKNYYGVKENVLYWIKDVRFHVIAKGEHERRMKKEDLSTRTDYFVSTLS